MDDSKKIIANLEKGDLHVHLNGLFSTELVRKTLLEEGTEVGPNFNLELDLNILEPKDSLVEYLKPWEALRLMPKKESNFNLLIDNAFKKLREDNIKFVELRSSISYLTFLQDKPLEDVILLVLELLNNASRKYHISYGLTMLVPRGDSSMNHIHRLLEAYENINKPKEIIALDLAGNEDFTITNELGNLFKNAKDKYGFNITIHAGETGNINNIKQAIELFGADRIGHGTAAVKSPHIMSLLANSDVCVEVCPISNRRTGAINGHDIHPSVTFLENGVPFVICSDNPAIHNATLSDDYYDFYNETGDMSTLMAMFETQKKYTFIDL